MLYWRDAAVRFHPICRGIFANYSKILESVLVTWEITLQILFRRDWGLSPVDYINIVVFISGAMIFGLFRCVTLLSLR
jgi:hypothetical protein